MNCSIRNERHFKVIYYLQTIRKEQEGEVACACCVFVALDIKLLLLTSILPCKIILLTTDF